MAVNHDSTPLATCEALCVNAVVPHASRRGFGVAVVAGASVLVAMSVWVADGGGHPPTTYASVSGPALFTDIGVGIALLVAGWAAVVMAPETPVGAISASMAVVWFAGDWIGSVDGPPAVRSVAMVIAPLMLPLAAHLALATPSWSATSTALRTLVVTIYVLTGALTAARTVFRNPLLDRYCWNNCEDNIFLVRAEPELARTIDTIGLRVALLVGLVVVAATGWRMARATPVARRTWWWIIVPAGAVCAVLAASAFVLLREPAEDPQRNIHLAAFFVRAAALFLLAGGVGWHAVRTARSRRAVTRLARDLGATPTPGSLEAALSQSLGDRGLRVAFRVSDSDRYVDELGRDVTPEPDRGQVTTAITRAGRPVALVLHDRSLADPRDLEREIGAAARLAVDNERLRAEMLARLEDVRGSRARIVEVADEARRRLERDLHDGAQQRLLAVSYELRLASTGPAGLSADHGALLTDATDETQLALSQLRDLAHGISPAVLFEAGLRAALESFADRSAIPVTVGSSTIGRHERAVESAAYAFVADAVELANQHAATSVHVELLGGGDQLVVSVHHDGAAPPAATVLPLDDRIATIGGTTRVMDDCMEARIPCAS